MQPGVKKSYAIGILVGLLAVVLLTPSAFPVGTQNGGTDLALLINGSSSIDAADFTLQKKGIKNALENTSIFPRDGSVALTIIQFAFDDVNNVNLTQVHVPYTVINSAQIVAMWTGILYDRQRANS